jgi:hypothetical protein
MICNTIVDIFRLACEGDREVGRAASVSDCWQILGGRLPSVAVLTDDRNEAGAKMILRTKLARVSALVADGDQRFLCSCVRLYPRYPQILIRARA